MRKSRVTVGKAPNTIEIHPDFSDIEKLRKSLIPENSNLKLHKVGYSGDITTNLSKMPEARLMPGVYEMSISLVTRARLNCPVIKLSDPVVDEGFDQLMEDIYALNDNLFPGLLNKICYKINFVELMDKRSGTIYSFKCTILNKTKRMLLSKINDESVEKMNPNEWMDAAIRDLADVFYLTCYKKSAHYVAGEHCMSLDMYRNYIKNL